MEDSIKQLLAQVTDPEIPVLSLEDLGVIRNIEMTQEEVIVTITPTYSGCPAMEVMEQDIVDVLTKEGRKVGLPTKIKVITQLSPAWTTDWITDKGKKALFDYGIMPPSNKGEIICPQCKSKDVELISQFSSTACKALYRCKDCLEPFDYFKCH
ncbi:MAG: 1,2-phenylacetyl-CoA epoxidase subunit PaaD [Marinicellaceae bacterium]